MSARVSVIVIFFDARRFLDEAVASVLAQSYDEWELLLVDDGSSDGSSELAQSYVSRFPAKIRYFAHDGKINRGMSASRNLGIRHASGEYLLMLDADDVLAQDALEKQVGLLDTHPSVDMVYGTTEWWYSWSGSMEDAGRDLPKDPGFPPDTVIPPPKLLEKMVRNEAYKPCGGMVRKRIVDRLGGYEETFRGMYEDQAFLAKLALGSEIFVSGARWYRYRKHQDSCCIATVRDGKYRQSRTEFLVWLEQYLANGGDADADHIRKLVSAELRKIRHPRLWAWSRRSRKWLGHARTMARVRSLWEMKTFVPPVGKVDFGDLRRLEPFSRKWGFERGTPIDRIYIERFLAAHSKDICGSVLEIGDARYTTQFGGSRVTNSQVLSQWPGPGVTIIADLAQPAGLPSEEFDCIILTQTFQYIYDVRSAACHVHRMLRPGGILLATVPGISPVPRSETTAWADRWYWHFTERSVRQLLEEFFPGASVSVESQGNVLTAAAFLYGLSSADLKKEDVEVSDPDYAMILTIRAMKEQG